MTRGSRARGDESCTDPLGWHAVHNVALASAFGASALLVACTTILGATGVPTPEGGGVDATTADSAHDATRESGSTDAGRDAREGGRDATRIDAPGYVDGGEEAGDARSDRGVADAGDACRPDACAPSYESVVRATGPLAYWRLDETVGSAAADATGHGNTGTYVGDLTLGAAGAIKSDPASKSVYLNPHELSTPTGYVLVGNPFAMTAEFTGNAPFSLEAWIKPVVIDTSPRSVVSNVLMGDAGKEGYILYVGGGEGLDFSRFDNGTEHFARDAGAVLEGAWHYVVATYDGTASTLYVDGSAIAHATDSLSMPSFTCTFNLGASHCGTSGFFEGYLGEVAVYGTALDAGTVLHHFNVAQQ
jgi:hypothetical protein